MMFSYICNLLVGRTPDGSKTIFEALRPAIVKVVSFETREYSYYADTMGNLYDSCYCADLGVWCESPDDDE